MAPTRRNKRKASAANKAKESDAPAKKKSAARKKAPPKHPASTDAASATSVAAETAIAASVAALATEKDPPSPAKKTAPKAASQSSAASASDNTASARKPAAVKTDPDAAATWNQMLFELILYKSEKGDFNVKPSVPQNKALHSWMKSQRDQFKLFQENSEECLLTKEQVAVLEYLQFPWVIRGIELWKRNYEKLRQFREKHGHSLVSRTHLDFAGLGDWTTEQRRQHKLRTEGKTSSLTDERLALLNEQDFVWKVRDRPGWEKRYAELVEFKAQHGHAKVPQHFPGNRQLGKWVAKQREQYRLHQLGKHSFMSPDRIQQLESVGFVWNCKGREPVAAAVAAAIKNEVEEDVLPKKVAATPITVPLTPDGNTQKELSNESTPAAASPTVGETAEI